MLVALHDVVEGRLVRRNRYEINVATFFQKRMPKSGIEALRTPTLSVGVHRGNHRNSVSPKNTPIHVLQKRSELTDHLHAFASYRSTLRRNTSSSMRSINSSRSASVPVSRFIALAEVSCPRLSPAVGLAMKPLS